jgi:hypothetical protein
LPYSSRGVVASLSALAAVLVLFLVGFPTGRVAAESVAPAPDEAQFLADADQALVEAPPLLSAGACPSAPGDTRLRCLLEQRYTGTARGLAVRLFTQHRVVAGVEQAHWMDGGFRGRIRIVPAWPTRGALRHLQAVARAHDTIERTLSALRGRTSSPVRYRHRGIVYRFLRSVRRTTPSAYAIDWNIGYNVLGSLNRNDEAILTTLVHEIFHLNDSDGFSERELRAVHSAIGGRCGVARRCLAPYSPTATTVRGGTYYAFQPDNGDAVVEYGAELASRYFLEQREMLERGRLAAPAFKCATAENAQAYAKVGAAFFAGVDLTPSCPR